ncbi:ABC transporter permease [Nocardiopsis rhodophaea]|uniref:ABC transporter permease n=1 Tax=Nocardiopsis rhodophaea TaxID=280238 RepID=UPI0031DD9B70
MPRRFLCLGWPLPPLVLLLPSTAITLVTWFATADQLTLSAPDWTRTSGLIADQARLPAVLAAASSGLIASRLTPRTRIFAQAWQVRTGWPTVRRHLLTALGWFLGAYLLGLVPLLWQTAVRAGHGIPDPLVAGGAFLGFAALAALGYLVGTVIATPLAVPAAAGAALLILYLPDLLGQWGALAPAVAADLPHLGMREERPFAAFRLAFSALALVVAAVLAAHLMRVGRSQPVAPYGAVAVLLGVGLAVVPQYPAWGWMEHHPRKPEVCEDRASVRVCVHRGHEAELAATAERAALVVDAYGPDAVDFHEVRDLSLARSHDDVLIGSRHGVVWLRIRPGWAPEHEVPGAIARRLVPDAAATCGSGGVARLHPGAEPEQRRAAVLVELGAWLESHTPRHPDGAAPDDSLFGAVAGDEVRAWIREEQGSIDACEVAPEELPWLG